MSKSKANRYRSGRCVHCLKLSDQIDDDHIFPASWYPDDTPAEVQRMTAPSCVPCNREHGRSEQDLLIRLGMCLDPEEVRARGIGHRARRSIRPEHARNPRDASARHNKRKSLMRDVEVVRTIPTEGVFPNFGVQPGDHRAEHIAVNIPAAPLEKLGRKIVTGLTYHLDGRFIDPSHEEILIFFVHDSDAKPVVELISAKGIRYDLGPGITALRAVTGDGTNQALFAVDIWGRLKIYSVLRRIETS